MHATSSPSRSEAALEGRWTMEAKPDGWMQMTLVYAQNSVWGRRIARAELDGLSGAQVGAAASTPVRFRILRDAGVLEMEGAFRAGEGSGRFRFHPDREFTATLRRAGIEGAGEIRERELMALALTDMRAADARELAGLLERMDVDDLVAAGIHGVTPAYVREMRSLAVVDRAAASTLVGMRIHGVTAAYVRELRELGYRGLDADDLVGMRIHGVTPTGVREYRALGYDRLSSSQLVAMRIHGVTPAFIRQVRQAGHRDVSADDLVAMRIHGISAVRGRRARP